MAAVCQVTGAVPGFGHNISHSHRRTKRRFDPNVQKKKYYVPSLRRTSRPPCLSWQRMVTKP